VDEGKINRSVKDLVADYDRLNGCLSKDRVEKLLGTRQFTIEEIAEVYRQLEVIGISIEDEWGEPADASLIDIEAQTINLEPTETVDFETWLKAINSKLLNADEEVECGRRMELGRRAKKELDSGVEATNEHSKAIARATSAREKMILANLKLVVHVARPYTGVSDLTLDDLFQEGMIGLMRAVELYDHTLGYKFSTFSTWWIMQSVTRALSDRGRTIRLPVHMVDDISRLRRATALLEQMHPYRRASVAELADELTWTTDKIHFVQQVSTMTPVSLDEPVPGHDGMLVIDQLVCKYESPEEYAQKMEMENIIDNVLGTLTPRERDIIQMRFGLDRFSREMTLEEIGQHYGLTRERIRQIETKALRKLRHPIRSKHLRVFFPSNEQKKSDQLQNENRQPRSGSIHSL
jgi:RNA polymerase primary sigma factor